MKRSLRPISILAFVFSIGVLQSHAQENTFTQYYLNLPAVNAGFTGLEDYLDLKAGIREGWNNFGVKDNNMFLSAYSALGASRRFGRRSNSLRVSDPEIFERVKSERGFRRKQGIGGMIYNRRVGPYHSFMISGNYAYHVPVSEKLNFSLGAKVGLGSQRIDFSGLTVRDDINDLFYQQLMQSQQGKQQSFLMDFGATLYSRNFFIGLSTQNMTITKLAGDQLLMGSYEKRYLVQSAGVFPLSSTLSMMPGVSLIYSPTTNVAWAFNARVRYKDLVYLGTAFDSNSKASVLVGLTTANIDVNYSYDQYLSDLKSFNVSVHEVMIGFLVFNKFDLRPRFW